jgi:hypothetical protein
MGFTESNTLTERVRYVSSAPSNDLRAAQAELRRMDRMSRQDLLAMLGESIRGDWMKSMAQRQLAGQSAATLGERWLERHASQLIHQVVILNVSCNTIPLTLRARDYGRCIELFEYVGWVPSPPVLAAYVLRHAMDCPVLSRYLERRSFRI